MEDSKLYSAQDIERLKQKIANYRKTLTTLKAENTFDDYLFIKDEFNDIQKQVSILEGEMGQTNGNQSVQNKANEELIKNVAVQSDTLNRTADELDQDLPIVLNEFSEGATSIEGTVQATKSGSISPRLQSNSPPSFKQLQSLVGNAIQIHQVSSNETPPENDDILQNSTEEPHFNKQSFLPSSTQPSQLYNGLYRNISLKTTIRPEYKNEKSANSVIVNENTDSPNTLIVNEVEENEIIVDETYEKQDITPVDKTEDIPPVPETKETVTENSNTMKQNLNKEAFSMFNIFRRRN